METILSVLLIFITLSMIGIILLQRSEGGGLGAGSPMGGMMTGRGAGNLLTKTTAVLGALFMLICLILATLAARGKDASSLIDQLERRPAAQHSQPLPNAPEAPISQ